MNESDILNKMADIEIPVPPDWQPVILAASIVLVIGFAVCLIIWQNTRRNRKQDISLPVNIRHSNRVLEELKDQWATGRITDREASYQLSTLLRLGLGLSQLSSDCPADITGDAITWKKTIRLFNQLRYRKITLTKLSQDEFDIVKKWLTHTAGEGQTAC